MLLFYDKLVSNFILFEISVSVWSTSTLWLLYNTCPRATSLNNVVRLHTLRMMNAYICWKPIRLASSHQGIMFYSTQVDAVNGKFCLLSTAFANGDVAWEAMEGSTSGGHRKKRSGPAGSDRWGWGGSGEWGLRWWRWVYWCFWTWATPETQTPADYCRSVTQ